MKVWNVSVKKLAKQPARKVPAVEVGNGDEE